uniref:Uncharacterized protein n=1 Tax=Cyanothece sp. (strain PCC 7425 / ATCC 29141) TaxID=395961 RepID=B8HJM2_CYAP4
MQFTSKPQSLQLARYAIYPDALEAYISTCRTLGLLLGIVSSVALVAVVLSLRGWWWAGIWAYQLGQEYLSAQESPQSPQPSQPLLPPACVPIAALPPVSARFALATELAQGGTVVLPSSGATLVTPAPKPPLDTHAPQAKPRKKRATSKQVASSAKGKPLVEVAG